MRIKKENYSNNSPSLNIPHEGYGHNRIINNLEKTLTDAGYLVEKNKLFSFPIEDRMIFGEIDLFALNHYKKILIATEVKSIWTNETKSTAYYQLIKDLFYFSKNYPDFNLILMYAYGKDNKKGYSCQRLKKNEINYHIKKIKKSISSKNSEKK
jgi:hypothetical protein